MKNSAYYGTLVATISVFVIFIVGTITWIIRKIRERKAEEKRALEEFMMEMEEEFSSSPPPAAEIIPLTPHAPVSEALQPLQASAVSPSPTVVPQSPRTSVEKVISRLRDAGLFISDEGSYKILDPSGTSVMVRLAKNKTALIVPRFESEYFIHQAMRRFDYVFIIISEERTIVLNKIEDYLSSRWEL